MVRAGDEVGGEVDARNNDSLASTRRRQWALWWNEARRGKLSFEAGHKLVGGEDPMQIPVLLEPIPGRGYRARGAEPFALEADGSTRDEALRRLSELIASRIEQGAELVTIDVPASDNPWVSCAGMFEDSALYDEWQAEIAARREGPD